MGLRWVTKGVAGVSHQNKKGFETFQDKIKTAVPSANYPWTVFSNSDAYSCENDSHRGVILQKLPTNLCICKCGHRWNEFPDLLHNYLGMDNIHNLNIITFYMNVDTWPIRKWNSFFPVISMGVCQRHVPMSFINSIFLENSLGKMFHEIRWSTFQINKCLLKNTIFAERKIKLELLYQSLKRT